jgi:threonine/homoserine/homoserine lactone efflux protein
MSFEVWLAFAAASTVLLVIPGPTTLTVISYSVCPSYRAPNTALGSQSVSSGT